MPLWIGETWICDSCKAVNAVLRKRCRICGKPRVSLAPAVSEACSASEGKQGMETTQGTLAGNPQQRRRDFESSSVDHLKEITEDLRKEQVREAFVAGRESAVNIIDEIFKYHPPESQDQLICYKQVRHCARLLAHVIDELVPQGADKTHAIRQLRDCVMWANAAIALKGRSY